MGAPVGEALRRRLAGRPRGRRKKAGENGADAALAPAHAPRVRRVVYAAALVAVCAVFPVFTGDAVGYVPLGMCVFALLLAYAYLRVAAPRVGCGQQVRARTCVRGEAGDVAVTLRNASPLPLPRVEPTFTVAYDSPEDGGAGDVQTVRARTALAGRSECPFALDTAFDHVGTYRVGVESVEVFDLFGLFSRTLRVGSTGTVRVVPRVHRIDALAGSELTTTEAVRSVRTVLSDDMDYAFVREYQLGDPMKTVHWKMSARGDERLYTKLFESHTNPGTTVLLDLYSTEADAERRACVYDTMLEAAFSVLDYARRSGIETDLVFRDRSGAVRTVRDNDLGRLNALIDEIPRPSAAPGPRAAADMLDGAARDPDAQANFVLITGELVDETVEAAVRLRHLRRAVRVVLALPPNLPGNERKARLRPAERLRSAAVPWAAIERGADIARAVDR